MSSPNQQLDLYRRNAVNSASPLQLVIMLYDGALRHMEAGRKAILDKDRPAQNKALQSAQKIVAELVSCLDMDQGGEIAQNLFALYSFCYNGLVEANMTDNPAKVDEARLVMINLRSGWIELEANLRSAPIADAA